MSDIFISYASADRDRARLLADALAQKGWSVWWDRTIPPGKEFDHRGGTGRGQMRRRAMVKNVYGIELGENRSRRGDAAKNTGARADR